MNSDKIAIIGCGDIGSRVALLALAKDYKVTALSRSGRKSAAMQSSDVELLQGDLDDSASLSALELQGAAVLYSAPPPGGGIEDTRARNFLEAIRDGQEPARIVYISSTSVYGDCGGELVTEARPANPANHTGRRRLDAEEQFRRWGEKRSVPVVILRVSGIYGPGRVPMERILGRHPLLLAEEAGYTNRIHADDLAQICLAAFEKGEAGDIFNICDGETSTMTDYFNAITDRLGLPRLPQVPLSEAREAMTPLMYGYMTESRRIDNTLMLKKLEIGLKYPTLKEGLEASIEIS